MNSISKNLPPLSATAHSRQASWARVSSILAVIVCLSGLALASLSFPIHADDTERTATRDESFLLAFNDDAWITEIGVLLFADRDDDDFFSGLSLSLDADTAFNNIEVYAAIDIASSRGTSTNNRFIRLFTTRSFDLFGQSFSDEYRVEIDLLNNYIPDFYDLRVTLIDARSERILDQVGAFEFSNLRELPLESGDFDSEFVPVADRPVQIANDDVFAVESAGNSGPFLLACLLLGVLIRSRRLKHG